MNSETMDRAEFLQSALDKAVAELATAHEREAALAAALDIARQEIEACRQDVVGTYAESRFAGVLADIADPAPILARVRRAAKREALEGLKAAAGECIKVMLFEGSGRHDRVTRDSYCEGVQDVIADICAALAALDAEEADRG